MTDYRIAIGVLTILIGIVSYSFYFRDIFRGKTRPDAYSWLIWFVLATITFFAQISKGAGPGAWATALTAIFCLIISITAFIKTDDRIKVIDVLSLIGSGIGVTLWYVFNNPLFAVIFAIIVGAFGFVPTFRKAFTKPFEETEITYVLNALKFALAFSALSAFNLVTELYPLAMVLMNVSLATMIFLRRSLFTKFRV